MENNGKLYQLALVFLALAVVFGVGVFVYREIFPEYKLYQIAYKEIEGFRSAVTGEPPAPFKEGIKQIVLPDEADGPEIIDRCISCHTAVDLPHFSPTVPALDVNDNKIYDAEGIPVLVPNPTYVWAMLDEKIKQLRNPDILALLESTGKKREAKKRLKEAEKLEKLKTAEVEGKTVSMTKVLAMHPLIGGETRPFEYHSLENYGCTSCHSGNGRALVAKRAHGPVFDGEFEPAFKVPKPQFTEVDLENDPAFARMYNDKPSHDLVFQTTPILQGPLLVAKCVQCHQSTKTEMRGLVKQTQIFEEKKQDQLETIAQGIQNDKAALVSLLTLLDSIDKYGYLGTKAILNQKLQDYHLSKAAIDALEGQMTFLVGSGPEGIKERIQRDLIAILDSEKRADALKEFAESAEDISASVDAFIQKEQQEGVQGKIESRSIFAKLAAFESATIALEQVSYAKEPLKLTTKNPTIAAEMKGPIDRLIQNYTRGKELYISQACYACHKIAGFSRSSVGPELTKTGLDYPWYVKESIVWPQADLPSSTMPNFRLDHEELADLMAFLMAQTGQSKAISEVDYQISLRAWEMGEKMPWEKPLPPTEIDNLKTGMFVYATEGCAACHKLEGFASNTGLTVDKNPQATLEEKVDEREWFMSLFPEEVLGSQIAEKVTRYGEEIDRRISENVRQGSILEELEQSYPGLVAGFYSNFKFAMRAKDAEFSAAADAETNPELKQAILNNLALYKKRVWKVLMVYIEIYGLGRDIAPHLNYAGVYRDDAWLMGHFHNPTAYTAKSIMPVMPFDDSKFYTLDSMLHVLGKENRNATREIWRVTGFNPPLAYELLCASCHGPQRRGNGIISEWIYPVPKNLRNPVFLRNLTKERAIDSITHGVKGTPMPPWGESVLKDRIPVLTRPEIVKLVDWLYQGLPQTPLVDTEEDYEKWHYSPTDVVEEMQRGGNLLQPAPQSKAKELVGYYFETRPNPIPGPEKELYYIRDKFYTSENLQEGQAYFHTNCATCHGKEGTGAGLWATSMVEAKPRMLTNLPWLKTRDDLRLLRSIKYGVPGTAMTPWGQETTSARRMQLVMYIRELTREQVLSDKLSDALYKAFDQNQILLSEGRVVEYTKLEKHKEEALKLFEARQKLAATTEDPNPEKLGQLYTQEISLKNQISKQESIDQMMQNMYDRIGRERTHYESVGASLIAHKASKKSVELFLGYIENYPLIYRFANDSLSITFSPEKAHIAEEYLSTLLALFDQAISESKQEIDNLETQKPTKENMKKLEEAFAELSVTTNLRTKIVIQLADAKQEREEQLKEYKELNL